MSRRCMGCMEVYADSFDMCPQCGYIEGTKPDEALHMETGSLLADRYLIGVVLGYGGFGVTYLGWDAVLEKKVAIKEYLPSEFATRMMGQAKVTVFKGDKQQQFSDGLEQFVKEAKRLAKFQNCSGIVTVYDSFEANNTAYIVMEYLDGETLSEKLKRDGVIDQEEAIAMLWPVLESLKIVNEEGLIHRDIAPDNIFITKEGKVKLIDFGASRYATTSHSRSLTVIIKPGYSPEEQYRSRGDQGAWTDVYAIAATLYKMITGITPPDALERRALFESKNKDVLVPISRGAKNITDNHETAILNALNIRIEDRTPNMDIFMKELSSKEPVKRINGKIRKMDVLRWPLWLKILASVLTVALLTFGGMLVTGVIQFDALNPAAVSVPEGYVKAPNLENLTQEEAMKAAEEVGLFTSLAGNVTTPYVEAGKVVLQTPLVGSYIEVGSTLNLTISKGSGEIVQAEDGIATVPYVIGSTKEKALEALKKAGLGEITIKEEYSDEVAKGLVIRSGLAAEKEVAEGTKMTLVISKGKESFEVANVVGMTKAEAQTVLREQGLKLKSNLEKSDTVPVGSVIRQIPESGKVTKGEEVIIYISSADKTVKVPNVTGQKKEAAIKELEDRGFEVTFLENYSASVEVGRVIEQTPNGGLEQVAGGTVTLFVSKGRGPVEEQPTIVPTQPVTEATRPTVETTTKPKPTSPPTTPPTTAKPTQPTSTAAAKVKVKYDANGGAGGGNAEKGVNETYGTMPVPTRDYYTFGGWYTAAQGGSKVESSHKVSGNITLYAHWIQNEVSDWVVASNVPWGAEPVERKWIYSHTQTSTSTSIPTDYHHIGTSYSDWSGWSEWSTIVVNQQTDPYDSSQLLCDVESNYIAEVSHIEYHYYRWTNGGIAGYSYPKPGYYLEEKWFTYQLPLGGGAHKDNEGRYWISADYEGNSSVDKTFTRKVVDSQARTEYRSRTRTATYIYRRDNVESASQPSGSDVSNVVEYIRYRKK